MGRPRGREGRGGTRHQRCATPAGQLNPSRIGSWLAGWLAGACLTLLPHSVVRWCGGEAGSCGLGERAIRGSWAFANVSAALRQQATQAPAAGQAKPS